MRCYDRALALDPNNTYAMYGMGNCHRWNRDYHRAIQCWEPLVNSEGVTTALLSRLGDMYRNVGRFEDAERIYLRGLESDYDKYALLGLVKLCCLEGREEEACRRLGDFFAREGFSLEIVENLASLYAQTGRKDAAVRLYRETLCRSDLDHKSVRLLKAGAAKLEGVH